MDYHSPDRTYKKSRFRRELERSVSRRLVTSLLLGCLLFLVAIAAVNTLNQNARREDHLAGVAATFQEVYNDTAAFLLDADHTELFLSDRRKRTRTICAISSASTTSRPLWNSSSS